MAKTIHTILYDDVLDGSKIIEMDNCVCQLSVIRRGYTEFIKEMKEELSKPALYILLNRENRKAYVGETDVFFKRIANHTANKEFWDEALAFTANDNSLTTTEVKYLESLSYETAKQAQSYDLSENSQAPTRPHATKSQEIKIKEFFKYVTLLTKFVGCDLFEKSARQHPNVQVSVPSIPKIPADLGVKPEDLAGRDVTIKLNGVIYPKSQMGYAVIKEYLKKCPKTSINELKGIIGQTKAIATGKGIIINDLGFDVEDTGGTNTNTSQNKEKKKKDKEAEAKKKKRQEAISIICGLQPMG